MPNVDQIFTPTDGLNLDIAPDQLPPSFISGGENIIPVTEGIAKCFTLSGSQISPLTEATHIGHFEDQSYESNWYILGNTEAEYYDGIAYSDATPTVDFTADILTPWSSVNFNGVIAVNNSNDPIHFLNVSNVFEIHAPVNGPPSFRFRRIGTFKSFLIGYGTSQAGGNFNDSRLVWSDQADPGTMPTDWAIGDPTSLSGSTIIASPGTILSGLELGDFNVIYKSDSIWSQRFVGGQFLFKFERRFANTGILSPESVGLFEDQHFVVTQNDIIVHNVFQKQSVADQKVREFFFNDLSTENWNLTRVIVNEGMQEIYVLYPSRGSETLDKCLIWRWEHNSWGFKDISGLGIIASSIGNIVETPPDDWNSQDGPWERDGVWRADPNELFSQKVIFSRGQGVSLAQVGIEGLQFGEAMTSIIERQAVPFGVSRNGERFQDYIKVKSIINIWVFAKTESPFQLEIITQEDIDSDIVVSDPITFDVSAQRKASTMISGVLVGFRITTSAARFILRKIEYEYQFMGEF